jgi:hypothetical protein
MEQEGRKVGRFEDGTQNVIGVLIEVHRGLGPGLLLPVGLLVNFNVVVLKTGLWRLTPRT